MSYCGGVAAAAFSVYLAGMVTFTLDSILFTFCSLVLRVLLILLDVRVNFETVTLILPVRLQKSQNRNNAASDVQKMQTQLI